MMNSSAVSWISELEMDSPVQYMDQSYDFMDPCDEDFAAMFGQSEFDQNNYYWSPGTLPSPSSTLMNINSLHGCSPTMDQPKHHHAPGNPSSFTTTISPDYQTAPAPFFLDLVHQNPCEQNFQQPNSRTLNNEEEIHVVPQVKKCSEMAIPKAQATTTTTKKRSRTRPPSQTYDHIIAERRRREQLSQLFVSLSALVPGLKKMDKSSVLEDAIKYLKHLQERVQRLEENAQKQATEAVVLVRKSQIFFEDEGSSSDEVISDVDEQPLPEIEARFCDTHILLRVHCEKHKGILVKLLSTVESLNMIVVNTKATAFGNVALDITIIAELEKEFNLTAKELVTGLRAAILQPAAV